MTAKPLNSPGEVLEGALARAEVAIQPLLKRFDGVLMLTHSQWHREPGSNRDQYARRLAKYLPVILVQPFLPDETWHLEATEVPNLAILNIGRPYGLAGALRLNAALGEIGWTNPLIWSFNGRFVDFIELRHDLYSLYHATENYVGKSDGVVGFSDSFRLPLRAQLQLVDLLVSVAEGVTVDHRVYGPYDGPALTISNGCDYRLWSGFGEIAYEPSPNSKPVIFYEGYINSRLDFQLIEQLFDLLPEWDWWFAGAEDPPLEPEWERLRARSNLKYLGHLPLRDIAINGKQATVGIIPFKKAPILVRSWPFKAFEYVSCGLPVVSTPVDALKDFPHLFRIADGAEKFADCIRAAAAERYSKPHIETRLREAASNSYDVRFADLIAGLAHLVETHDWHPRVGDHLAAVLPEGAAIVLLTDGTTPPILQQVLADHRSTVLQADASPGQQFDLAIATTPDAAESFANVNARGRCVWFEEPFVGHAEPLAAEGLLRLADVISSADVVAWTDDVARTLGRWLLLPEDKPTINLNAPPMKPRPALSQLAEALGDTPRQCAAIGQFWQKMRDLTDTAA